MFRLVPIVVASIAGFAMACVYDGDRRCPESYVLIEEGLCGCPPGYEPEEEGGVHRCVVAGYGDPCVAATGAGCTSPSFPACVAAADGSGYCTKRGCTADRECPRGWACRMDGAGTFCQRAPSGQGQPCGSDAECAGTEASFCESSTLRQCLVRGCDVAVGCGNGFSCCDFTSRGLAGTLCIPTPVCP